MCAFVCRLIQHTKALMSAEEKLCIKVLRILQEMLIRTLDFDEKVSLISSRLKKTHYEEDKLHSCILLFVVFRFLLHDVVFKRLCFLQGIPLRKVLLQNYLFPNKKTNPKNDLAELGAAGRLHVCTEVHATVLQ